MAQRQASLAPIVILLAAAVVVLVGVHLAASFLNPVLFALVLSLLFSPLYRWLQHKGVPTPLALILMLIGLVIFFGLLFGLLATSVTNLASRLATYTVRLDDRTAELNALLQQAGISTINFQDLFKGSMVVGVVQAFLGGIASFLSGFFFIIMTTLFFLAEGPAIMGRLRTSLASKGTATSVEKLTTFGRNVVRQFGLRGIINAVTGAAVTVLLVLIGVDFPVLWGILVFFLSYIPYIGTFLAAIPPVILALAEFGLLQAVLVIVGYTAANLMAENVLSPFLMSRGLSMSPTVVFLSFAFWVWLLGGPGAFLAMPLTFLLILFFDSFSDSRWLADLMVIRSSQNGTLDKGRRGPTG
jgi:predicted PurR-regulated permease PerM